MPQRNEQTVNAANADEEIALAAEAGGRASRDRQHDAVGDQVGGQRPGRLVVARRKSCRRYAAATTLTMVVSRTSMNAASVTATAISHGFAAASMPFVPRCGVRSSAVTVGSTDSPSGSGNCGSRPLSMIDLDRHALHDLDEIAGGVLRGKRGEARAAAELDAVDMAAQLVARVGVDLDVHRLARAACARAGSP